MSQIPQIAEVAAMSDEDDLELLSNQVSRMGADVLEAEGLNGKGMRIAIFDVGFSGADRNPAFDHLRASNRVVKTRDFVKNKDDVFPEDELKWDEIARKYREKAEKSADKPIAVRKETSEYDKNVKKGK